MPKREFLQLAHNYNKAISTHMGGWWLSEKYDGIRAFWDGGISTGLPATEVPWANTRKDGRLKDEVIATGLWSRYGKVIHAPYGWLRLLPPMPLDGELWAGRGRGARQKLMSTVKRHVGDFDAWCEVKYMCFEAVNLHHVLRDGTIDNLNFKKVFSGCSEWARDRVASLANPNFYQPQATSPFRSCNIGMTRRMSQWAFMQNAPTPCCAAPQIQLPDSNNGARDMIDEVFYKIINEDPGAEGVMVRNPNAIYDACRAHHILKRKAIFDAEGTVVGFITGERTSKGSKLLGKIGSITIEMDSGLKFQLSGFTDDERELEPTTKLWALDHPNQEIPLCRFPDPAVRFRIGDRICYKFRELTADGYPQEARYDRTRDAID